MIKPVRILIAGGNASGCAAAAKAKRFNPNADVLLFEASEFISTGTCEMPYVLSGEINDYRKILFFSPSTFQSEKGVKVFVKHFVEEIHTREKRIAVKNIDENKLISYDYDSLILATGSKAKTLPGFDTNLKNIFTLKNVNDLIGLKNYIQSNKVLHAVIIGAGYIGLESAEALVKKNIRVTIIEKERNPLPGYDEKFAEEILKILTSNNVEFIGGVDELEPVITGDKLLGVRIGKKYIETDLVLLSIGFEPDTELAGYAKIEIGKSGGIKVDRYLKTSERFIYSAGDNTEVVNAVTGKPDYIPLATLAYKLGHIAGENASGGNSAYEPFVKNISVKIFNKYFASVGLSYSEAIKNGINIAEIYADAHNLVEVMPGSETVLGKILTEKNSNRLIGASFLGGKEVSGYADLLSALIKLKTPASLLSKIDYNYTPPLSPFINLLNIAGKKSIKNRNHN